MLIPPQITGMHQSRPYWRAFRTRLYTASVDWPKIGCAAPIADLNWPRSGRGISGFGGEIGTSIRQDIKQARNPTMSPSPGGNISNTELPASVVFASLAA